MERKIDAISFNNVSKLYRAPSFIPWRQAKKTQALNNVSFFCPTGKISCLLGPNGAGKTTIIKIISGLITPCKGEVIISSTINKIGLATTNDRSFYWRLTGRQNLDFFASLYGLSGKSKKNRVQETIKELGLTQEADKPFRLYSSGMKQKLIFARAILSNPEILLLDEPTAHIDPITKKTIYKIIKENFINRFNMTILLCTHDLSEAQLLADQIVLLDKGKVIEAGSLKMIRKKINPHLHIKVKLASLPDITWKDQASFISLKEDKKTFNLEIENEMEIPKIVQTIIKHGGQLLSCEVQEESLLSIFYRLTGGDE